MWIPLPDRICESAGGFLCSTEKSTNIPIKLSLPMNSITDVYPRKGLDMKL